MYIVSKGWLQGSPAKGGVIVAEGSPINEEAQEEAPARQALPEGPPPPGGLPGVPPKEE